MNECPCVCHGSPGAYAAPCDVVGGCGQYHDKPLGECVVGRCTYRDGNRIPLETGSTMCRRHFHALRHMILDAGWLIPWINQAMVKLPKWSDATPVQTSEESPAPLNVPLLDVKTNLWRLLRSAEATLRPTPPIGDLKTLVEFLIHPVRFGILARSTRVAEFHHALGKEISKAHSLAPWRPHELRIAIPCPGCDLLTLSWIQNDTYVQCRNPDCPQVAIPSDSFQEYLRNLAIAHRVTPA